MNGWAVKILRGLAKWMTAIGGWLLRRRAKRTWAELAAYLRIRGDHLEDRARRVSSRSQLRAEWLTQRARRWRAAAAWLEAKAPDLDRALEDVEGRAKAGVDAVPDRAIEEIQAAEDAVIAWSFTVARRTAGRSKSKLAMLAEVESAIASGNAYARAKALDLALRLAA